jgi:NADP-dependent 3-hydroxy acid dehydrogenase YdfG
LRFASEPIHLHLQNASKITKRKNMKQTILVTGASSGFGLLVATKLHESGYKVIGTSRNPENYTTKLPFKMIALDLDSEHSIDTFSERIFKETNQLDVLINNAGFLVSGIAEETPISLGVRLKNSQLT